MEREKQQDINHDTQETINPSQNKNPKATKIQELFAGWEDDGLRHQELDWGKAEGKELKKSISRSDRCSKGVKESKPSPPVLAETSEAKACSNQ